MAALEHWIWLSAQTNISVAAKARLLSHYGDADSIFYAPSGELAEVAGISRKAADTLEKRDMSRASRLIDECAKQKIQIITAQDAGYPKRLKNIYAPPAVLYVKGQMPAVDENVLISVIGTRNASAYGLKLGREMSYQIARCGGIVVSGLTRGIDAEAAKGALLAGGSCVAVLGTAHEGAGGALIEDVAAKGAVISEYPPMIKQQSAFFRDRNRISAGLSLGVLVVEAPARSGTRLFVNDALEQGKEIFAVPGNADSENSVGTNELLREGAMLVTQGWQVMAEFEHRFPDKVKLSRETPEPEPQILKNSEKAAPSTQKVIDKEKSGGYIDLKELLSTLTDEQLRIAEAIRDGAAQIDDIIEQTGLPTAKVLSQLTILEIRGIVRRGAARQLSLNTAKK